MHIRKVLAGGYWQDIAAKARAAAHRRAAVAFVTEDLVGFKKGDVLVVNAALRAIRTGATSAKLLLKLHDIGVLIYNCPNLHAKVLLLRARPE